jgi:hypothetical protein
MMHHSRNPRALHSPQQRLYAQGDTPRCMSLPPATTRVHTGDTVIRTFEIRCWRARDYSFSLGGSGSVRWVARPVPWQAAQHTSR